MPSSITAKDYRDIREVVYKGKGVFAGKQNDGWYWEIDPDTVGRPHGPHKTADDAISDAKVFIDS